MAFRALLATEKVSLLRQGARCLVNPTKLRELLRFGMPQLGADPVNIEKLVDAVEAYAPGFHCIPFDVIETGIRRLLVDFVMGLHRGRDLVVVNTENLGGANGFPTLSHDLGRQAKSAEWLAQVLVQLLEERCIDYVILDRSMTTQADLDGIADLAKRLEVRLWLVLLNDVTYRGTQQCCEIRELVDGFPVPAGDRLRVQVILGVALQAGLRAIQGCCADTHPHVDLQVDCGEVLGEGYVPGGVIATHKVPDSIPDNLLKRITDHLGGPIVPHYKNPARFPPKMAGWISEWTAA